MVLIGKEHLYMRSVFRYRFNSLLIKIFISYLLILSVVLFAGFIIYYDVDHVLEKKETNVSEDYLKYVSRIIDGELQQTKERMYGFLQSPENIIYFNTLQNDISSQVKMVGDLANFMSNSNIISGVYIYNRNLPFVISNTGTASKGDLFGMLGSNSEETSKMLDSTKNFRLVTFKNKDGNHIALITGASYSNTQDLLVVFLNENELYNVMMNTNIVNYGSAYMIDRNGFTILSSEQSKIGTRFDMGLIGRKGHHISGMAVRGTDNLVVSTKSSFFDGYYVTDIPYSNILKESYTIRNIFIYAFLILLLIGFVIAGFYSRMIYHPIAGLIEKLKPVRTMEGKFKDEIDWIRSSIDYIQTRNSRYEEDLILGRLLEENVTENVRSIFPHSRFQVMIIASGKSEAICNWVKQYLKEYPPTGFMAKATPAADGDCYLVVNGSELQPDIVHRYLSAMKNHIETKHNLFTVVGIGSVVNGAEKLQTSVKNAITAIKQGSPFDDAFLYEYSPETTEMFHLYFPIDFENRIMDALMLGSEEKVAHMIHYVFEQNKDLPQIYMKIIYTKFIDIFMMLANKCGLKYKINEISEHVDQEYRGSRVRQFIANLYVELIPHFHTPMDTAKRVENFVTHYISQNYNRDLGMDELADALKLSAPYVSTLFKKSKGISFSQYLLEYRMKKAIELLLETDYSVKEISQKVGTGTYNSFIRSFRTLIGVSPGEYRMLNQQKNKLLANEKTT